ncbi:MAG: ADP-ribosylglycohydrolase family protein [Planctomycetota bacterium]|nr:ADP-ribosylglycohydrolase family protein [Planctomycetota bacterium]
MAGWEECRSLVKAEFAQCIEEGCDPVAVKSLAREFDLAGDDEGKLLDIWRRLLALPIRPDFPFQEPSDLAGIQQARPAAKSRRYAIPDSADWLFDRLYGAWLGRCAGCALGKPSEGYMGPQHGLASKDRLKAYLTAISPEEWPLRYYLPGRSPAEDRVGRLGCPQSQRENIAFMESDDDIRYTVLGQIVLQQHGRAFGTHDVANAWLSFLPYHFVCTAETQAYRNLVIRYRHPRAGEAVDWIWVATHQNPYREWIGAQIRADAWGYAAPGWPALAAEFAWRDARLSHVKNGIYGEMFVAAMIAAAFALDDPQAIVEAGLAEIPATSRLYADMRRVIAICQKHGNDAERFEAVLDEIYALFPELSPVHTINNAALVVAALLLGKRDFEKVITIAVMGGWDSDCNGATAGSIAGAMLGAARLPEKWIAPLHDTLYSQIIGYHPISIRECAQRSVAIAQKVLAGV